MNLRKEARGRECMVRIPGVCNHNPETVVLAHLNGGGMGRKRHDMHGAWCCSACHDVVDGRKGTDRWDKSMIDVWHLDAVIRTQEQLIREGKL